jgi:hypothetical protein
MSWSHLNEIFKYLLEILAVLGITIEIIPVKFSPLKWLGDKFNGEIKKELASLRKEMAEIKKEGDMRDIRNIRSRIANFGLLVRKDENLDTLDKAQYVAYFKDRDKWIEYHDIYKDLNGELKLTIEYVDDCFKRATFKD